MACPTCDVGWSDVEGHHCWFCGGRGVPYATHDWNSNGRHLAITRDAG